MAADDPKRPFNEQYRKNMFSQIGLLVMGLYLLVDGLLDAQYVHAGIGLIVGAYAATTLYKLKTGK